MNEITKIEQAEPVVAAQSHKNVWCALAAAQMEMGKVAKGATNPAFKTRYADLADVASVVIPVVARHGIATLQYMVGDSLDVMRTEFVHGESETRVNCDVRLIVGKNDMQGMKSATTYAKRIGLESLSGVAPEDDDGNAAVVSAPRQQTQHRRDEPPREAPVDHSAKADAMIAALKSKGIAMKDHPRFSPDLDALRKASPEDAARVDFTVQQLTPDPNADLGGDEIPY